MLSDIEISQNTKPYNIKDILPQYKDIIEPYGFDMAKISYTNIKENWRDSKFILVTSVTPTKSGIGKTTVSIGLNDALNKLGKNSIAVLREPSLGPCFGMKGGACGGGYSQVIPMEKINLHFTGDFHAITSANNLIAASLDNYIYQNHLENNINILFKRCIDMNDRSLRNISYNIRSVEFNTGVNITPASELMAIFCLAKDIEDLRHRIDDITVAECQEGYYITVKDLGITGSVVSLLSEAFKPNLVQSLEHNPVIIHGGPFANIAHGCNSVVGLKLGASLSEYVVTEAGFGSDLGYEKFWDIVCFNNDIKPACVVLCLTIDSLKQHGSLETGLMNLKKHHRNIGAGGHKCVICINKKDTDTIEDINAVKDFCNDLPWHPRCVECTSFKDGSEGAVNLADEVLNAIEKDYQYAQCYTYKQWDNIIDAILKICVKTYSYPIDNGDSYKLDMKPEIEQKLMRIQKQVNNLLHYRICIAKTQYSLSDDPKLIPDERKIFHITDIELKTGSQLIVVYAGDIMTMPGLPKVPQATKIDFINDKITGLS